MGSGPAPDKYRGRCDGAVAGCGGGFSIVQTVFADGGYGGGLIDWT